jgi:hypothetical protein
MDYPGHWLARVSERMMQVPIGGADCRASQINPSQGARRAKRTDIIHILHLLLK